MAALVGFVWFGIGLMVLPGRVRGLPFGFGVGWVRGLRCLGALLLAAACACSTQASVGLMFTEWLLVLCAALSLTGLWLPLWPRAYSASVVLSAVLAGVSIAGC
jgi:hypothetical protein